MQKPNGVGLYIWIIRRLYEWFGYVESDPEEIKAATVANWLHALGIKWVIIKLTNATWNYNLRWDGSRWVDDRAEPFIRACIAKGIQVWGFGYVYGDYPATEGRVMGQRIVDLPGLLSGWVINAEGEMKHRGFAAIQQCEELRSKVGPNFPLALSSYRYPEVHPELPWDEYLKRVQHNMPQVYWMGKHNPGEQLSDSNDQFILLEAELGIEPGTLGFLPTGAAFNEHGWVATEADIIEFSRAAQGFGFEAISYWEAWEILENGFELAIAQVCGEWDGEPPPVPGECPNEKRVTDNEANVRQLHLETSRHWENILDLQERVSKLEAGGLIRMVVSNERKNKVRTFYPLNDHELAMHLDQTRSFATGQVFTVTNPKEWKTDDDVGKQLFWQVVCEGDYPCPKPNLVNGWVRDRDIKQV